MHLLLSHPVTWGLCLSPCAGRRRRHGPGWQHSGREPGQAGAPASPGEVGEGPRGPLLPSRAPWRAQSWCDRLRSPSPPLSILGVCC